MKSPFLVLIIGDTKMHDSASSHYDYILPYKKYNIVVSMYFSFSRVSFKVTLKFYHPLL